METLFVLTVIAGVFNVIAAIYFVVAYQQGGSMCLCVRACVCVRVRLRVIKSCDTVLFWEIIKTHFRFTLHSR